MGWPCKLSRSIGRLIVLGTFICFSSMATEKKDLVEFEKKTLTLAGQTLLVEMALSARQRQQGLMYRKQLPPGSGMLFVFPEERVLSFWMKNTFVPISIGYFTKDKRLAQVLEMVPESLMVKDSELRTYPSLKPVKYALEVPKGWFKKHKVKIGSVFRLK